MYLEERVEQLENASVDQGKQIELVAGGLATLTVEVRGIRQDMTDGFAQVREEFAKVRQESAEEFTKVRREFTSEFTKVRREFTSEFAKVRQESAEEFTKVRQEMAGEFAKVNQRLDEMSTTQQLILTILTEKLK